MGIPTRIFGLPHLPEADFNRLFREQQIEWHDADGDAQIDPNEVNAPKRSAYVADGAFTKRFEKAYRFHVEQYRKERVKNELRLSFKESVRTDIRDFLTKAGVTAQEMPQYLACLRTLLKVAPIMERLYQRQIGYAPETYHARTPVDRDLTRRYGHPWCLADLNPFCSADPTLPDRSSGVIDAGISCAEVGEKLDGLGNPFSAVVGKPVKISPVEMMLEPTAVPYATYYANELRPAAFLLREAALQFYHVPREKKFAAYLLAVADAFESTKPFPYEAADAAWIAHQGSDSLLMARIGADEVGGGTGNVGDECGVKARFHFMLALKDLSSAGLVEKFKPYLQQWEHAFATLIGDPSLYKEQPVALHLPDFLNVILQVGDGTGGPNGTNIGQTLPNWCGPDGMQEPCSRRIMIFTNKTLRSYRESLAQKFVLPLFHPDNRKDFGGRETALDAVVLHEITHNIGPQQGKPKPGTAGDFGAPLQKWKGTFEELKAQMGSLYHPVGSLRAARADFAAGKISQEALDAAESAYRKAAMGCLVWSVRMVMRATRTDRYEWSAYSRLAAVQLVALSEAGALAYDLKNGWWKVDYETMMNATEVLTQKVLRLYAEGDFAKVDAFINHAIVGLGLKELHIDRLQVVGKGMPSALFEYQVTGVQ